MTDHTIRRMLPALVLTALAGLALGSLVPLPIVEAQAPAPPAPAAPPAAVDDEELARLYKEDQADRRPPAGKEIDWSVVGPRDEARLKRVKELYAAGRLKTGADYYHAAMVLQHAAVPEDYLLAHELCVAAIAKGEERGKWLAAASEDRFLMNIGRPQRFGTQFRVSGPDGAWELYKMDEGVTDELRKALDVPPLADAKALVIKMSPKQEAQE